MGQQPTSGNALISRHLPTQSLSRPLAGFTFLDLTQFYQGPYATFLLAQAGADVIKIEPPRGESLRHLGQPGKSGPFAFAMLNSNKRSVTLNLKSAEGRALLHRMVAKADALIENFAPGVMDRLGVGWQELRKTNPALVYASATGFGLSGPDRDNLAMDFTIQAASGVMSLSGTEESGPMRTGAPYVDILGGAHLYAGLVTALLERARTGRGRLVEVAMIEAVYPCLATALGQYHEAGQKVPARTGNEFANRARAPYGVYPTRDGGYVGFTLVTEMQWQNLLRAMGREDLKDDPRFKLNADRIARFDETEALVTAWTSAHTREEVFAATSQYKIPCAPVRDLEEVMNDPHMHGRGTLQWMDHYDYGRVVLQGSAIRYHETDPTPLRVAPRVGEHNAEIYESWLGLDQAELDRLRAAEAI